MNYEQRYKEALERAKHYTWYSTNRNDTAEPIKNAVEAIFPELIESEDERIRKEIISYIKSSGAVTNPNWIAWLKKQGEQKTEIEYIYPKFRIGDVIEPIQPNGNSRPVRVLSISKKTKSYCCESDDHNVYSSIPIRCENEYKLVEQKPAEWSEEDEKILEDIADFLKYPSVTPEKEIRNKFISWLNSIKERVLPKQEWSEDDKAMLLHIIEHFEWFHKEFRPDVPTFEIDWLKSLKPNHWKPSKEQLETLWDIIPHIPNSEKDIDTIVELSALYEELKQL